MRRSWRERGQGLVEFAVLLPLLMMITMGVVDLGRAFFAYTEIANAAREGAMYGSLKPTDATGIRGAVTAELGSAFPVTTTIGGGTSSGSTITVTVQHDFQPLTTAVVSSGTVPIKTAASMVVQ